VGANGEDGERDEEPSGPGPDPEADDSSPGAANARFVGEEAADKELVPALPPDDPRHGYLKKKELHALLRRYLARALRAKPHEADDATQNAVTNALIKLHRYPRDFERFMPYLLVASRNAYLDHIRRERRAAGLGAPFHPSQGQREPSHEPLKVTTYEILQFLRVQVKDKSDEETMDLLLESVDGEDLDILAEGRQIPKWTAYKRRQRFYERYGRLWAKAGAVAAAAVFLVLLGWVMRHVFSPTAPITKDDRLPTPPRLEPATADAGPPDPMAADVTRLVRDWSLAMDQHDLATLARLYADSVAYYDEWDATIPRARVLAAKRSLLGPGSTFHQDIVSDVAVTPGATAGMRAARFRKHSGSVGHEQDVIGTLVVDKALDGRLVISAETDEEAIKTRTAWRAACEKTADEAVHQVPAVQAFDARAATETSSDAEAPPGTPALLTLPPTDLASEKFAVVTGYATETALRSSPRVEYTVDRETGRVDLKVSSRSVPVPPEAFAAIARACARPQR
jgi:DNA-directed RNA polymerase specialized sigma24 family protein